MALPEVDHICTACLVEDVASEDPEIHLPAFKELEELVKDLSEIYEYYNRISVSDIKSI